MKYICTDSVMLNTKGPNQSFGNHLLHLFACWKISKSLGIELSINCYSNLDELFDLEKFKNKSDIEPILLYTEKYGGTVDEHVDKDIENNNFFNSLLQGSVEVPDSFYMKGWFWNSVFLPNDDIFKDLLIKEELLKTIESEHSYLKDDSTLVIHYRGTDFSNHSIGWGDLRLKSDYYTRCMEDFFKDKKSGKIVVVTDDYPDFLVDLCNLYSKDVIVEKNDYLIDWLILLKSKNLICSNSSFCYTAGWYSKEMVYQPDKFFTRYIKTDLHYPAFPYYKTQKTKIL